MSESKFSVDQQRRMLVKGLGATTLALTLMPTSLFAAGRGPTAVIVGAGIAGLSAAWELRKAEFKCPFLKRKISLVAEWSN